MADFVGWLAFGIMVGVVVFVLAFTFRDYLILKRLAAKHSPIDGERALSLILEAAMCDIPVVVRVDGEREYAYNGEQALFEITPCGKVRRNSR